MKEVVFIPRDTIKFIHEKLIDLYGGISGIRNLGLLGSALKQPKIIYDGDYLHNSLIKMAAGELTKNELIAWLEDNTSKTSQ
jgi:death on curing protein